MPDAGASLLDRLLSEPAVAPASLSGRRDPMQDLRDAARRDLSILLNTRCRPETPPEALRGSLADFGVEDFFNSSLVTDDQRRRFAARLRDRIRRFEPRLDEVEVTLPDRPDPSHRSLRLRISARYRGDDAMPPLIFETQLDPVTQRFSVAAGARS